MIFILSCFVGFEIRIAIDGGSERLNRVCPWLDDHITYNQAHFSDLNAEIIVIAGFNLFPVEGELTFIFLQILSIIKLVGGDNEDKIRYLRLRLLKNLRENNERIHFSCSGEIKILFVADQLLTVYCKPAFGLVGESTNTCSGVENSIDTEPLNTIRDYRPDVDSITYRHTISLDRFGAFERERNFAHPVGKFEVDVWIADREVDLILIDSNTLFSVPKEVDVGLLFRFLTFGVGRSTDYSVVARKLIWLAGIGIIRGKGHRLIEVDWIAREFAVAICGSIRDVDIRTCFPTDCGDNAYLVARSPFLVNGAREGAFTDCGSDFAKLRLK